MPQCGAAMRLKLEEELRFYPPTFSLLTQTICTDQTQKPSALLYDPIMGLRAQR